DKIDKKIASLIESDGELAEVFRIVTSVPGIGRAQSSSMYDSRGAAALCPGLCACCPVGARSVKERFVRRMI
ncbi:hypothetical protein, partial [Xylanibacter rodentium]